MNARRFIFPIFLATLALIILYNLIFAPVFFYQGNMHMEMGMYNNNSSNVSQNAFIFAILIVFISAAIYFVFRNTNQAGKCDKCGAHVEDDRWKICPICGSKITNGKGDKK